MTGKLYKYIFVSKDNKSFETFGNNVRYAYESLRSKYDSDKFSIHCITKIDLDNKNCIEEFYSIRDVIIKENISIKFNIYNKLSLLKSTDLTNVNDIMIINMRDGICKVYSNDSSKTIRDIIIPDDRELDTSFYIDNDEIVRRVILRLGLDLDGDRILANVFINQIPEVIKEIENQFINKNIPYLHNKEYQNIDFYDGFIGTKVISRYSDDYINTIYKMFKILHHERVIEFHKLSKIVKESKYNGLSNAYLTDCVKFWNEFGFDMKISKKLVEELIESKDEKVFNSDMVEMLMKPLREINYDYAKRKLHVINVELSYINRNLKALKREIRRRKENHDNPESN